MIYLLSLALLSVAALLYQQRVHNARLAERETAWEKERSSLLTRIQHPEMIQRPEREVPPDEELLTTEHDEYGTVGQIGEFVSGDGR